MMLLVASVVFLYYTIWTLFIVCSSRPCPTIHHPPLPRNTPLTNSVTAIRRRRPPTPRSFSSPRLGDPYPRDSHPRGYRCGRQLPERCHDQEWEEEGGEGEGEGGGTREEEELSTTLLLVGEEIIWGKRRMAYCICLELGRADTLAESIKEGDLIKRGPGRAHLIARPMSEFP